MVYFLTPFLIIFLCLCDSVTCGAAADIEEGKQNITVRPPNGDTVQSPFDIHNAHPDVEHGDDENAENMVPFNNQDPEKTVDSIAAKANDWREPSRKSEVRYVLAIRQWLDSLDPFQRERAKQILREAHPGLRALRTAIREKKHELSAMSFGQDTNPEKLPRLGQELQILRQKLRSKLDVVAQRLRHEAGVPMGPLGGDGFWLAPQQPETGRKIPAGDESTHSDNRPGLPLAAIF